LEPEPSRLDIQSSKDGVTIEVKDGYLVDVLQGVADESDIRFRVSDSLVNEKINADVRAPDWDSGVPRLLKGASTVALWDENSQLKKVSHASYCISSHTEKSFLAPLSFSPILFRLKKSLAA
jgi:hypothetical protein